MKRLRVAVVVILAGCVGMLVGAPLFLRTPPEGPDQDWFAGPRFPLTLIMAGFAVWHLWHPRRWKLVIIALLAAGAIVFNIWDVGSGPPAWNRGYAGEELVGIWLFLVSAGVVFMAAIWSLDVAGEVLERPVPTAARAWWTGQQDTWWWRWRWALLVSVVVAVWILGLVFNGGFG